MDISWNFFWKIYSFFGFISGKKNRRKPFQIIGGCVQSGKFARTFRVCPLNSRFKVQGRTKELPYRSDHQFRNCPLIVAFFRHNFLHESNYLIYVNSFLQYLTFYCIYLPVLKFEHWRFAIKLNIRAGNTFQPPCVYNPFIL